MRKLICLIRGHKIKIANTIEKDCLAVECKYKTTYCARCHKIIERTKSPKDDKL